MSYWVDRKIQLSSKDVKDVKIVMVEQEPNSGSWKTVEVSLKEIANNKDLTDPSIQGFTGVIILNKKGQKELERLTEKNIGRRLAIVLKDKLLMAPVIQEKITGNEVSVVGLNYNDVKSLKEAIRR
jgi:preprotein translocase subunit SecD